MSGERPISDECENCGRLIGRLETPHVMGEHVVCSECHRRLIAETQHVGYASPSHPPDASVPPKVQVVEATAKVWKALQAVGGVVFAAGAITFAMGMHGGDDWMVIGGRVLAVLGFVTVAIGLGGAWWYHG